MASTLNPPRNCPQCPRLVAYRLDARTNDPGGHNAPVPNFGDETAELLIVGLAPGLKGANRTGRPFTGDYAGDLLYRTLIKFGFAKGQYQASPDDGLALINTMITNAVRCVPPENKPTPAEIRTCRPYLEKTIDSLKALRAIIALGRVAHDAVIKSFGQPLAAHPFAHAARHDLEQISVFDSYHCSRYNTNTGVLTDDMFEAVFAAVKTHLQHRR